VEPTAGRIRVLGQDVLALDSRALRRLRAERVGMVFQHMALLPHRTVRDNVAYPLEVRGEALSRRWSVSSEKLQLVGLSGYEERFPHELSGGMQQRVGLARALASDPEVLLMDEPFSSLDPLIRRDLQDQFVALSRQLGKTTLFVTHDMEEAIRIGSRVAIMKDGRVVQVGTPAEIVTQPVDDYVRSFVQGIARDRLVAELERTP
jgi:glycine betaine/proline transport system ATP-binding protein